MLAVVVLTVLAAVDGPLWTVALVHHTEPGMPPAVAERVHSEVRSVLSDVGTLRLQRAADTLVGVDGARQAGWKCDDGSPACMSQLGKALAVGMLIEQRVSGQALTPIVSWRVIDVGRAEEVGRLKLTLPADLERWPSLLRSALEELPLWGGAIRFHFAQPVAEVNVGGRAFARPGPELLVAGLPPGALQVQVVMEDLSEGKSNVDIVTDSVTPIWVMAGKGDADLVVLAPRPRSETRRPPPKKTPPSNTLGFAGIATSGAGVAGVVVSGLLMVGSLGMTAGGAGLLSTLAREPTSQRVMAREGQSKIAVMAQLFSGVGLMATAFLGGAAGALLALVGAGVFATGLSLLAVQAFRKPPPDPESP